MTRSRARRSRWMAVMCSRPLGNIPLSHYRPVEVHENVDWLIVEMGDRPLVHTPFPLGL